MSQTVASPKNPPETIDPKEVELISYWLKQMDSALEREKDWRKSAAEVLRMYEGEKKMSYNVVYSNTEVLMPALYSATPKPAVMRRLKTKPEPIAAAAADILNKALQWTMDTNDGEECEFDQLMADTVLAAVVPGRGQAWFTYDARFKEVEPPTIASDLEELKERDNPTEDPDKTKTVEQVTDEYVCPDIVPWDQFLHGFAKTWSRVPWVARCHKFTKTEMDDYWPECANLITYEDPRAAAESEASLDDKTQDTQGAPQVSTVYQIWDKTTQKVYWVSSGLRFKLLEPPVEDPLKLSGFFPCPEPLHFVRRLSKLTPKTLYTFYAQQAEELEEVSQRLRGLIKGMRMRGMYNALIDDIAKVLDAEENKMIPITNAAALDKGLSAGVFMVPIQDYVPVIQELWLQREQIKKVIAEITGISDIIRGSTVASETATAQDIKNRWGTLRLQDMQKRVQRFARDCIRIMAEIMANHFDYEKFQRITGVQLMTAAEKQQVTEALQQQAQMAAAQGGQPPQVPPEMQDMLAQPTWEEVIAFLRDKVMRQYKIDIETDSTLADEVKQDSKELTEILTAVTQMVQAFTPAVQGGFLTFDVAKSFILGFVRRFRLGAEVEEAVAKMQQPPPQDDAAQKAELQMKQQEMEQRAAEGKLKLQQEQMKFENDRKLLEMDMQLKQEEHRMKMEEMQLNHAIKLKELEAKSQAQMAQSVLKSQEMERQQVLAEQQHQQTLEANSQQQELAVQNADLQRQSLQDKAAFQQVSQKQKMQQAKKPKPKGE